MLAASAVAGINCGATVTTPSPPASSEPQARSGTTLAAEDPSNCSFALGHADRRFGPQGGAGAIAVTASAADCAWSATVDSPWIEIVSGRAGIGSGTIEYRVAANHGASGRSGKIAVDHQTVTIAQDGAGAPPAPGPSVCTYGLTSPKSVVVGLNGGSGVATFKVTGGSNCSWTAAAEGVVSIRDTSGTGDIVIRWNVPEYGVPIMCVRPGKILVRWHGPQEGENLQVDQRDELCF